MIIAKFAKTIGRLRVPLVVAINGAVIMILELSGSRILAPYFGSTLYVWTAIIGVIMVCLSVGYWYGGKLADQRPDILLLSRILLLAAMVLLLARLLQNSLLGYLGALALPALVGSLLATFLLLAPTTLLLGLVSPFAARLQIRSVADSGKSVGAIYAAGTIGSILGTFATGYILFATLGNTRIVLMCVLLLVLASAVLTPRKDKSIKLALAALVVLLLVYSQSVFRLGSRPVLDIDTQYNRVLVHNTLASNGRPARVLQTDGAGIQSGVFLDGRDLPFEYTIGFLQLSREYSGPYLVIGGGAYSLPRAIADEQPLEQITTVEIDTALAGVAQQYFEYTPNKKAINTTADARQFLQTNNQRFGIVFVDAYNSISPPFHLTTSETAQAIAKSTAPEGLAAINAISSLEDGAFIYHLAATYRQHFAFLKLFAVQAGTSSNKKQNVILLASQKPIEQIDQDKFYSELPIRPSGRVLTDDFAPVEALTF